MIIIAEPPFEGISKVQHSFADPGRSTMHKALLILGSIVAFAFSGFASGPRHVKSHVPGSNDGYYPGGEGSSHKGGHYSNENTGSHYRDRKGGTPY